MRILVLYSYFDQEISRKNLSFFNDYGMCDDAEYCLIVNGGKLNVSLNDRWKRIILRENKGHDFGAWKEGLLEYRTEDYDYFFFLNDTVIGPLGDRHWLTTFTSLLNEETKLAGISINCVNVPESNRIYGNIIKRDATPHVQSMFWCTDRVGINIIEEKVFKREITTKLEIVIKKELGLSEVILDSGYNITCILPEYQVDYRKGDPGFNKDNGKYGDTFYEGCYFGRNIHPYQSIFFKNTRFITPELIMILDLQRQIKYY